MNDNAMPRPWKLDDNGNIVAGDSVTIQVKMENGEMRDHPSKLIALVYGKPGNSELIVAAVNAYDAHRALVEAAHDVFRPLNQGWKVDDMERRVAALGQALRAVDEAEKGSR